MNSKKEVLSRLKLTELGEEVLPIQKIDGLVPLKVLKGRSNEFCVGKWNDKKGRFVIMFDPTPGLIHKVLFAYKDNVEEKVVEPVIDEIDLEEEVAPILPKKGRPKKR